MSSHDDLFDDETLMLSPICSPGSPEPFTPLLDCLENESNVSMNETNPLISSQQSNLMTYQGIRTLLQNPLEMQQHQHQVLQQQQQQLGTSLELWFQDNLSNGFLSQSMLNTFQESSGFTRNQIEIGQVGRQGNNGFAHPTMTSSPIHLQELLRPTPLIHEERSGAFGSLSHNHSIGSQNYLSYQMPRPVTSYFNMYDQQQPQRMVNNLAMTCPLQNQTNMIPTFNVVPQRNISSIPRPQVSSSFIRHCDGMQRSVNVQSSSTFRFSNNNTPIRPYANSIIPPQDGVLGSKRPSYQTRFEFGQSSSQAQRRKIAPAGQNSSSVANAINLVEQRQANNIYNPIYESLGLCIDPHLRNYSFIRTD